MTNVYAFATPNSVKIPIALEELGVAYRVIPINVRKGEQNNPAFLSLNPNGKVPAIVDEQGAARGLANRRSVLSRSLSLDPTDEETVKIITDLEIARRQKH